MALALSLFLLKASSQALLMVAGCGAEGDIARHLVLLRKASDQDSCKAKQFQRLLHAIQYKHSAKRSAIVY